MSEGKEAKALENGVQPVVSVVVVSKISTEQEQKYKRIIKYLAISEIVLGSVCMAIGIATLSISRGDSRLGSTYSIGEALWGGVWIVIAGILGVPAAKSQATPCIIYCHMSFSIFGSACAGLLFAVGIVSGSVLTYYGEYYLMAIFVLLSFVTICSMALLITSAVYCGKATGCCYTCNCEEYDYNEKNKVFVQKPDGTLQLLQQPYGTVSQHQKQQTH